MADLDPVLSHFESQPLNDSLFPFLPESVLSGLRNLQVSSNSMLDMVTFARGPQGAADELYANLPFGELQLWHEANRDFTENGRLLYRAGLLYGIDLTLRIAAERDISPTLRYDDGESFTKALQYLRESYRGLEDDADKPEWLHQKERELLYTGSDVLTLANATLDDKIRSRLYDAGHHYHGDALAQHVGIIDGAIFINAYRAYRKGQEPTRFERPVIEYTPSYDKNKHVRKDMSDLAARYEFEDIDEILGLVSRFDDPDQRIHVATLQGGSMHGTSLKGIDRFVQVGANAFATAIEIQEVTIPGVSKRKIGVCAAAGVLVDLVYILKIHDLPFSDIPIATILNTTYAVASERRKVKKISKQIAARGIASVFRAYEIVG